MQPQFSLRPRRLEVHDVQMPEPAGEAASTKNDGLLKVQVTC